MAKKPATLTSTPGQSFGTPAHIHRVDAVRAKLAALDLREEDIDAAVDSTRQRAGRIAKIAKSGDLTRKPRS
jgi:hypothetical protein